MSEFSDLGKIDEVKGSDDNDNDDKISPKKSYTLKNETTSQNIAMAINMSKSEIASQWLSEQIFQICNPLVVVLGIGEYDGMDNLIGMGKDYQRMIAVFNKLFGYDILYRLQNNEYNINNSIGNKDDSFKLRWTCDEIEEFVNTAKATFANNDKNYDALIFIISAHGDDEGVIYDSDLESYPIALISGEFNGSGCPEFAQNPKLFFIDACRGEMRSPPIQVTYYLHKKLKQIIIARKSKDNTEAKSAEKKNNAENQKNNNNKSGANGSNNDSSSNNDEKKQVIIDNESAEKKDIDVDIDITDMKAELEEIRTNVHREANFCFLYANPDGYKAFDGGTKGGYLIRAIYRTYIKKEITSKYLNDIFRQIGTKVEEMTGRQSMEHVQMVSNVHYKIQFKPRKESKKYCLWC